MNILFCGGGTFGHVAPALAAAEAIRKMHPEAQIAFVGRRDGAENESIRSHGYRLYEIPIESLGHKSIYRSARAMLLLLRSFSLARRVLKESAPDLVFGTGGYVCYPVLRMAQIMGIRTLIHESNAVPGRACRMLARSCDGVLLGVEDARERLPKDTRCIYTGNPVREDFFRYSRQRARHALGLRDSDRLLLSFGGSGGAGALNAAMLSLMRKAAEGDGGIYHVHAAGKKYFEDIRKSNPAFTIGKGRLRVYPFLENMPLYMCAADLCICRSGAMTVAELTAAKLPSILIPSPNVTDDHQRKNAESLAARGGALICDEKELSSLEEMALGLLSDRGRLSAMRQALSRCGSRDAAREIANAVVSFLPDNK
ncbi:MAG: UDP-N-acetylglucosamine--N-acetylmuramyl-(pentapeptide) pyrophosphoryl-undecaprenol N-acetylglucosamine transferase [Clostridia bacterium]|nr:UDP-N-acetylglucosamine--N-acetylmuramyl-(pentapeptide) pyrophosphoryl-undecaprenol N-acetylglucosamine transferase [Clostridia bacterium]